MASALNLLGKDCSGQELVSPFRQMDGQTLLGLVSPGCPTEG